MQIIYTPKAKEHLNFWIKSGNKPVLNKILKLTNAIIENPFEGIDKPEALKYELTGYWSRRITQEHRYVYAIAGDTLLSNHLKGITSKKLCKTFAKGLQLLKNWQPFQNHKSLLFVDKFITQLINHTINLALNYYYGNSNENKA